MHAAEAPYIGRLAHLAVGGKGVAESVNKRGLEEAYRTRRTSFASSRVFARLALLALLTGS
jgi:hypothetical protein